MTSSSTQRGDARQDQEAMRQDLSDAMQKGLTAFMAIPQKTMQANLAVITESVNFMNRRMKAQAALWSGLGQLSNGGNLAEMHQHFINAMAQEMADEMKEMGELSRKNMALMTNAAASVGRGSAPGKSS